MVNVQILELRHVECEPPAGYLPVLTEHAEVVTVRPDREPLPEHHRFAAIIAMGGPMGVGDRDALPWITDELRYLRAAVDRGIPVWGVCLGAQLLAAALDARVFTGPLPEVGVCEVRLTDNGAADPVWGGLPNSFPTLQWHSDTFELPAGARRLAGSTAYPNQVFRYGASYGVQFHLEVDVALAEEWLAIDAYRESLRLALGADGERELLDGLRTVQRTAVDHAQTVLRRWLAAHVLAARPS